MVRCTQRQAVHNCAERLVQLAIIASHPAGGVPIDAGDPLAHNGKIAVYSQYFLRLF
jgi:hypothetical protein